MGLETWSMAFYDQPRLVKRIITDRLQFGKDLLKRVLSTGYLDFVQIWEDMAYKTASMISHEFVRESRNHKHHGLWTVVWWANRKIRQEREKCCDEMAIARLSTLPRDYSRAILEILATKYESSRPVPSLAVAGPVKNIEKRIKTMLRPGKKFYKRPSLVAATTILLVALLYSLVQHLIRKHISSAQPWSEPVQAVSPCSFWSFCSL